MSKSGEADFIVDDILSTAIIFVNANDSHLEKVLFEQDTHNDRI